VIEVATAAELSLACHAEFPRCNVLLMAAAVADFRPASPADGKLKKTGAQAIEQIALEPTEDVLSTLASARTPGQLLVGFAAEHGDGAIQYGREKLAHKGIDAIVVNDISRSEIGFDATDNEVMILDRDGGERRVELAAKAVVAAAILDEVQALWAAHGGRDGTTTGAAIGGDSR
jgi:phosphopantothenoylcysteine decarboxylase / phosphopantothenate---cysteine ligase